MTYEFFAIRNDGIEVSVLNEDIEVVKKSMQEFCIEFYDTGWLHCTLYHPHENSEYAKNLARKKIKKEKI